jgi:hypothetical protein
MRFSRSYLDDEDDPVLELDFYLKGGVTEESLRTFLMICRVSYMNWLEHME